jgi:hypothetical protein
MADVVIIMGAGCSAGSGAPMMLGFLDRARDLLDSGKMAPWDVEFKRVFHAIGKLGAVHSKARLDIVNLESVFNTFEMATQLQKFPDLDAPEIEQLVPSIITVIVRTLEESMWFPVKNGDVHPTDDYQRLASSLKWLTSERTPRRSVAVISFNYDIALEVALERVGIQYTYRLAGESGGHLPLLKLHGSLNWHHARDGDTSIQVTPVRQLMNLPPSLAVDLPDKVTLPITRVQPGQEKPDVRRLPFIVPPTMSKGEHHRRILPVWKAAAEELTGARHIFVCGYSMQPTDEFFRVLFALGSQGKEALRSVVVLNPDKAAIERIGNLLGPGAEQRFISSAGWQFNMVDQLIRQYG